MALRPGPGCRARTGSSLGAHVHACAGDRLAEKVAPQGFLARELPVEVPAILDGLR